MKVNEKGSQIREGKAKILFETLPHSSFIIQSFKDDATAFNAKKKGQIRNKGVINNAMSTLIFKHLEQNGVPTHFVEKLSDRDMLVHRVQIVPVEVVVRNRATGSITTRLGIQRGTVFEPPLVEYFYKSDALGDPLIGEGHILYFQWASESELREIFRLSLATNRLLKELFNRIEIDLIDFKLEFGRTEGRLIVADEFSPDVSRLWSKKTGESLDKDRFRQDLGRVEESYEEVFQRLERFFSERV